VGLAVLVAVFVLSAGYHARVQPIPAPMRAQMVGVSWHRGCPVALSDLRLITLTYRGFDGRDHTGRLIANRRRACARRGLPPPLRRPVPDPPHGAG
jgi:hypothetical protein